MGPRLEGRGNAMDGENEIVSVDLLQWGRVLKDAEIVSTYAEPSEPLSFNGAAS